MSFKSKKVDNLLTSCAFNREKNIFRGGELYKVLPSASLVLVRIDKLKLWVLWTLKFGGSVPAKALLQQCCRCYIKQRVASPTTGAQVSFHLDFKCYRTMCKETANSLGFYVSASKWVVFNVIATKHSYRAFLTGTQRPQISEIRQKHPEYVNGSTSLEPFMQPEEDGTFSGYLVYFVTKSVCGVWAVSGSFPVFPSGQGSLAVLAAGSLSQPPQGSRLLPVDVYLL